MEARLYLRSERAGDVRGELAVVALFAVHTSITRKQRVIHAGEGDRKLLPQVLFEKFPAAHSAPPDLVFFDDHDIRLSHRIAGIIQIIDQIVIVIHGIHRPPPVGVLLGTKTQSPSQTRPHVYALHRQTSGRFRTRPRRPALTGVTIYDSPDHHSRSR